MSKSIAVLMSVYRLDNSIWLRKAIDSILEQSYSNFTLFIYVDGTVGSDVKKVLKSYGSDNRVVLEWSEENRGLAHAMNYLICNYVDTSEFDFVARMDADDICHPDRFAIQLEHFDKYNVDVMGSDCIEIDEQDREITYKKMKVTDEEIKRDIVKRCPFNHPTVIIRASVFKQGFLYDPTLRNTQDYFLWIDLAAAGFRFLNVSEPLLKFRVSEAFYEKRGLAKAKNDFKGRVYAIQKMNDRSLVNYVYAISIYILRLSPPWFSKICYKYLR